MVRRHLTPFHPPHDDLPWDALARELDGLAREIRDLPVLQPPDSTPDSMQRAVRERFDLARPTPLASLIPAVAEFLRGGITHVTHPRYFGLFNPSVRAAGIAGDALAAGFNLQLAVWSHAPAALELERLTLQALGARMGFGGNTLAHFASGGAEANLSAVLVALAARFPASAEHGIAALDRRPAIYVGEESHHSFVKIARMAGLGTAALREARVTDRWTLDVEHLARRIAEDRAGGWAPLLVVGTAGTTSAGVVDDLPALADLARREGAWFHVDAAWGGAAALSDRLRPTLGGIERADSVTWDAHKWLNAPMGAGMFFCRHPDAVRRAFTTRTSYMPAASGAADDPYLASPQWSRRSIGLKVFFTLAELGLPGAAALVERQAEMGERLREQLREAGWEIVNDTPLPVICFTRAEARAGRLDLAEVVARIHARRRAWISRTVLGGRLPVLRACITSWRTEQEDLDVLVEELEGASRG